MRDLRAELQDRAQLIAQQISAEHARFQSLLSQLKAEQDSRREHLVAQLRLANKLYEFTVWQSEIRDSLAARIAVAEVAESRIANSLASVFESKGLS
jgi:hypothetical protein